MSTMSRMGTVRNQRQNRRRRRPRGPLEADALDAAPPDGARRRLPRDGPSQAPSSQAAP